jgi:hypothetical protein
LQKIRKKECNHDTQEGKHNSSHLTFTHKTYPGMTQDIDQWEKSATSFPPPTNGVQILQQKYHKRRKVDESRYWKRNPITSPEPAPSITKNKQSLMMGRE